MAASVNQAPDTVRTVPIYGDPNYRDGAPHNLATYFTLNPDYTTSMACGFRPRFFFVFFLLALVFGMTIPAVVRPQLSADTYDENEYLTTTQYYFYKASSTWNGENETTGDPLTTKNHWSYTHHANYVNHPFPLNECNASWAKWRTAYAFAVMAIISSFFAMVAAGIAAFTTERCPEMIPEIARHLNVVTILFLVISWAIVASMYHLHHCTHSNPSQNGNNDLVEGFALLVTAFVFAALTHLYQTALARHYMWHKEVLYSKLAMDERNAAWEAQYAGQYDEVPVVSREVSVPRVIEETVPGGEEEVIEEQAVEEPPPPPPPQPQMMRVQKAHKSLDF